MENDKQPQKLNVINADVISLENRVQLISNAVSSLAIKLNPILGCPKPNEGVTPEQLNQPRENKLHDRLDDLLNTLSKIQVELNDLYDRLLIEPFGQ